MNLINWTMNFLLMLAAYGTPITPGSDVAEFDFNGNGVIDSSDIMHMLSLQVPSKEFGVYQEK
tara:strand:+ start:375 stop:563 length:189 start_codon:yes stop_codon:yes gene_type:complete